MRQLVVLLMVGCGGGNPEDTGGETPPGNAGDLDGDGSPDAEDCDDENPLVRPGIPEACDGLDTDCDAGTGESGTATVNGTTSSDLQSVLDAAGPGDQVAVCGGVYPGPLTLPEGVTLRGLEGSAATIVEGVSSGAAIVMASGEIGGIGITGGLRGLVIADDATALLTDVVITACDAGSDDGGGMLIGTGAEVTLDRGTVSGNSAARGAGIALGDGATLLLVDSFVDANTASDLGGGVLVSPGATLEGGGVRSNLAARGAGLGLLGDATLQNILVSANNASEFGGGIYANEGGSVVMTNVLVSGNFAEPAKKTGTGEPFTTEGGGVYANGTALVFDEYTTVTLNAAIVGGGVSLHDGASLSGGGVGANLAVLVGGGVAVDSAGAPVSIQGTLISSNAAPGSGGLHVVAGDVTGTDVVISMNSGEFAGGGFGLMPGTTLTLTGGELTMNDALGVGGVGGGGILLGSGGSASELDCTDVLFGSDADKNSNRPDDLFVGSSINRDGLTTLRCVAGSGCN